MNPEVDVIVPVHSATRPVDRAVGSVLRDTAAAVRVTVVAHNIDVRIVRERLGELADNPRVRVLELHDGIHSPAGPFNLGLDAATASFTSVLGSDDALEPGAIDSWLEVQRRTGAAAVIGRINREGRVNEGSPAIRRGERLVVHPVLDRLAYRSAPIGLVSREVFGDLRFDIGLVSGEDLAYVSRLWFSGKTIAYDRQGPAYYGFHDAEDRVTGSAGTIASSFEFLPLILDAPWFSSMSRRYQLALVVKILRVHVFDALANRLNLGPWPEAEKDALLDVVERLVSASPGAIRLLSRVDRGIVGAIRRREPDGEDAILLLGRRWNHREPRVLLPRNPFLALHSQAPLLTMMGIGRAMALVERQR